METTVILALLATTLAFSTPLLLAALGEVVAERAGVLNIGLEGMMLVGAWAGAAASFGAKNAIIGIGAAIIAGVLLASLFALLAITFKADAIVVGTGLNLFALGLTGVAHRTMIARYSEYEATPLSQWFFVALAVILVPLLWWGLRRTKVGLKVRAVGEYPQAADAAGVHPASIRWWSTLANGAACGVAGAFLSMSQTTSFGENMTNGRGFIALAIVIFGRWSPFGALAAALLFGAAQGLQNYLQLSPFFQDKIGAYYPLLLTLPYVLTLLTLAGAAGKAQAPAALGQPYEGSQ